MVVYSTVFKYINTYIFKKQNQKYKRLDFTKLQLSLNGHTEWNNTNTKTN